MFMDMCLLVQFNLPLRNFPSRKDKAFTVFLCYNTTCSILTECIKNNFWEIFVKLDNQKTFKKYW